MITLTRRQARCLRGVFRRSVLGITHRGSVAPLVLHASGGQLRAQYRYAGLAVECVETVPNQADETITLPLDALADLEGHDDVPVVIETAAPDRTVARWVDRGIPQSREYDVTPIEALDPFPESPIAFAAATPGLLDALAEAAATAADDTTRYALNCLQLRGATHEMVATDGRQLLIQGGFPFPWNDNVLIRRAPIFAAKTLPRDQPLGVGKTDAHVILKLDPWTFFLEIAAGARFPAVEHVLPGPGAAATRLRLDPDDAHFLVDALDRLPGLDECNSPATLDLNGCIAVRARATGQDRVTELVLARSTYSGTPVRIQANRSFLARAIRLGFTEVEITDADSPVVCRSGPHAYVWQPLSKDTALAPADDLIRIDSAQAIPAPARRPSDIPNPKSSMRQRSTPPVLQDCNPVTATPAIEGTTTATGAGLAALIQEAEALHETLGAAKLLTHHLIAALRRHRKQARVMTGSLEALQSLRLQDVAR